MPEFCKMFPTPKILDVCTLLNIYPDMSWFPKTKVAECPDCSQHFASQKKSGEDGENVGEDEKGLQSTLYKLQNQLQDDDQQRISSLENDLIKAKLDLAEARERGDQLELRLYAANAPAAEKSWYKKITNQMKK